MTARGYDVYLFWFRRETLLGGRGALVYLSQATFPADESVTDGDLVLVPDRMWLKRGSFLFFPETNQPSGLTLARPPSPIEFAADTWRYFTSMWHSDISSLLPTFSRLHKQGAIFFMLEAVASRPKARQPGSQAGCAGG